MNSNTTVKSRGKGIVTVGAVILLYMITVNGLRNTGGRGGTATPFTRPEERRPFMLVQGSTIPVGSRWSLTSLRGKIVLLNYAATWCAPCRRETPDLAAVADSYGNRGVVIVALMMDEGKADTVHAAVAQYAEQYTIPYPLVRPDDDPLLQLSGLGLPTSILLDRQGRTVRTYLGPISRPALTADIERLLGESAGLEDVRKH